MLLLIGRCDGWGCSYSHTRSDLEWTDEEIKLLLHQHFQLIDTYNGRINRNPYSVQPSLLPPTRTADWIQAPATQPYPTPSASGTIDSATLEAAILDDSNSMHNSWNVEVSTEKPSESVHPDDTWDAVPQEQEASEEEHQTLSETETPLAAALNPFATPFVPDAQPSAFEELATTVPLTGISEVPFESEAKATTHELVDSFIPLDQGIAVPNEEKAASKQDIASWGAKPEDNIVWDEVSTNKENDWRVDTTGGGGWDAPPDEDAFKMPPRTSTRPDPVPSQKAYKPFKGKDKLRVPWKEEKAAQSSSSLLRKKSDFKKPEKPDKFSSRQQERRQSAPVTPTPMKQEKRHSAIKVSYEEPSSSSTSLRDGPPHQAPEAEIEECTEEYRIEVEPGSIMPAKGKMEEIIKANLQAQAQLAKATTPPSYELPQAKYDLGMLWVNGGTTRPVATADPPREFSQRSGASGSVWGRKSLSLADD